MPAERLSGCPLAFRRAVAVVNAGTRQQRPIGPDELQWGSPTDAATPGGTCRRRARRRAGAESLDVRRTLTDRPWHGGGSKAAAAPTPFHRRRARGARRERPLWLFLILLMRLEPAWAPLSAWLCVLRRLLRASIRLRRQRRVQRR